MAGAPGSRGERKRLRKSGGPTGPRPASPRLSRARRRSGETAESGGNRVDPRVASIYRRRSSPAGRPGTAHGVSHGTTAKLKEPRHGAGDRGAGVFRPLPGLSARALLPWLTPWAMLCRSTSFDSEHRGTPTLRVAHPESGLRLAGGSFDPLVGLDRIPPEVLLGRRPSLGRSPRAPFSHGSRHGLCSAALRASIRSIAESPLSRRAPRVRLAAGWRFV